MHEEGERRKEQERRGESEPSEETDVNSGDPNFRELWGCFALMTIDSATSQTRTFA